MERREEKSLRKQDEYGIYAAGQFSPSIYIPEVPAAESAPSDVGKYWNMIVRRWRLMVAAMAIILALGAIYTFTRAPKYESTAEIVVLTTASEVPTTENDVPVLGDLQALTRSRSVDTQVELISSPNLINEAYNLLGPGLQEVGFKNKDIPVWAYKVYAKRNTDVVAITARAYSAVAAAALANSIANTYFTRDAQQNAQVTRQARIVIEDRLNKVQNDLENAHYKLAAIKQSTGLFAPDSQLSQTAEQMARLNADLETSRAEYAASRNEAAALRRQLAGAREDVPASTTVARNPRYDAIVGSIDSLNSQRAQLLQEYTSDSREVRAIEERIRREEAQLRNVSESMVASKVQARNPAHDDLQTRYATQVAAASAASARVSSLRSELNTMKSANRKLPSQERQLTEQLQQVATLEADYKSLSDKHHALLLREQAALPNGILVSEATVSDKPVYPNKKNNMLFFFLLGAIVALAAAVVSEWRDVRVHDQNATEQMSQLTTLSMIPEIVGRPPLLLDSVNRDPVLLESFRILRNNVRIAGIDQKMRLLAVTSPSRGDGKSTTSLNLAIAMAMEGRNVLLVDGDLRRPSIHNLLRIPGDRGLTSVLSGATTIEKAIVPTEVDHLFCLPAGPACPNPPEMLDSPSSRELFRSLAEIYDTVIVDCPPSTGLSDVQIISSMVDGVLLVVSMNRTLRPHLLITIRTLKQTGAPLAGLVLNRANVNYRGAGYYDYCTAITPASEERMPRRGKQPIKT